MKFTTRLTRLTKTKLIVISIILGLATGLGSYTFIYAKGYSYLTNDPNACANCHVMQEQFDGWVKSSHRNAATCNDCHTPSGFVAKYANKASNGFWHSFGFTTGWFHEPIQIKPHNREITENACRTCHTGIVDAIEPHGLPKNQLDCLQCHRNVGHLH